MSFLLVLFNCFLVTILGTAPTAHWLVAGLPGFDTCRRSRINLASLHPASHCESSAVMFSESSLDYVVNFAVYCRKYLNFGDR